MGAGDIGPDLVIAGSARSGTTQLAARLALHPDVDACAVKEPNFFSREVDRGPSWYDSYFRPRTDSLVRMDASVSYTFPQYPDALRRLAEAAPEAVVVYVVRDAVDRAVSHYLLYRYYFGHETAQDLGAALRARDFYQRVSDYEHWLERLHTFVPSERLLVVPFHAVTSAPSEVVEVVLGKLGLDSAPEVDEATVGAHKNNVVTFRSDAARSLTRRLRHSAAYPTVRRVLGPHAVKRLRSMVTRVPDLPSVDEALATCDARQRAALEELRTRSGDAVAAELVTQDARLGVDWGSHWARPPAPEPERG